MELLNYQPIGFVRQAPSDKRAVPRQGNVDEIQKAEIVLNKEVPLDSLKGIEGFSHLWILFVFHKNDSWNPLVQPPRLNEKMGVFATRAPHRPNPIGMSAVNLVKIEKNILTISGHDLLEGTPILDIKPYIEDYDAIKGTRRGWLDQADKEEFMVVFSDLAKVQAAWLLVKTKTDFLDIVKRQLRSFPTDQNRKRIIPIRSSFSESAPEEKYQLAFRTWRAQYTVDRSTKTVTVFVFKSGYSNDDLAEPQDVYKDKEIHKEFLREFDF